MRALTVHELGDPAEVLRLEVAGVGAFEHRDSRVGAQCPRQLTAPHVDLVTKVIGMAAAVSAVSNKGCMRVSVVAGQGQGQRAN